MKTTKFSKSAAANDPDTIKLDRKYLVDQLQGNVRQDNIPRGRFTAIEKKLMSSFHRGLISRGDFFGHNDVLLLIGAKGLRVAIPVKKMPATLGAGQNADFSIQGNGVSRTHCRFVKHDSMIRISDNHSLNGTFVNGSKLTAGIDLKENDEIMLGVIKLRVRRG